MSLRLPRQGTHRAGTASFSVKYCAGINGIENRIAIDSVINSACAEDVLEDLSVDTLVQVIVVGEGDSHTYDADAPVGDYDGCRVSLVDELKALVMPVQLFEQNGLLGSFMKTIFASL